ncbi:uncharacterized protein PFL1_00231 [Pseudozyma flocculosa PF-1]|uniref:Uncharacterized protein n=1 Tax=Pseudozyma flocculosa TaxID=84751 RepID=A0A5C3EVD2_9BASI|nr:uncharacterized protein PFL1_00231 [Pseudozyma flocculosa PF-1]EPQ32033.1 hypothetical protein PFL1_00231 [Pseudozyma flocculosa PF-1]SPO35041.1 uncharacterized protein PSFLO_00512 [Pseudozyma flocculosa]
MQLTSRLWALLAFSTLLSAGHIGALPSASSSPLAASSFPPVALDANITPKDLEVYNQGFDEDAVFRASDLDDGDGTGDPKQPGWVDPRKNGGSMLDLVGNGLREPINVIISGRSDPHVLSDAGLKDYVRTIGFSFECLNLHMGNLQRADLGDGKGWRPEMFEYRETQWPGAPGRWVGACWESLYGGNHFRAWKQNGTLANTGAWFLAVSKEKNLKYHHTIDKDGYNLGRDLLVEAAQRGGKWQNWRWKANVEWADDLLQKGRRGINHNIPQDGRTAILTVYRVIDSPVTSPGRWLALSSSLNAFAMWITETVEKAIQGLGLAPASL